MSPSSTRRHASHSLWLDRLLAAAYTALTLEQKFQYIEACVNLDDPSPLMTGT